MCLSEAYAAITNLLPCCLETFDLFFFFLVCVCVCTYNTFDYHQCSAECGQGNRTRAAICLTSHVTDLPLDSCGGARPAEVTPCDSGPCQKRLEWYTGPWGLVTLASAPFEVFHLHTSHAGAFLPSVLCRVRERHTDSYFIWGGGGRVHSGQVDTNEQIKTDHSGRLL